jgi:hypothetical protein
MEGFPHLLVIQPWDVCLKNILCSITEHTSCIYWRIINNIYEGIQVARSIYMSFSLSEEVSMTSTSMQATEIQTESESNQ